MVPSDEVGHVVGVLVPVPVGAGPLLTVTGVSAPLPQPDAVVKETV